MPASLIPVCRRWCNLINSTASLWSKISIDEKNIKVIPFMLSSPGFQRYLSRTDGLDIPLDIEIRCYWVTVGDHDDKCGPWCREGSCTFVRTRREQLHALFTFLADTEIPLDGVVSEPRSRLARWRELYLELDGTVEEFENTNGSNWMREPSRTASRLSHLILRNCPPWYQPHGGFAPNLKTLEVNNINHNVGYRIVNAPSLKSLSLQSYSAIAWEKYSGTCMVEELSVAELSGVREKVANICFPHLRRLKIRTSMCIPLLTHLSEQLRRSNRRLDLVHLINYTLGVVHFSTDTSIITNARKIILTFQRLLPSDSKEYFDQYISSAVFLNGVKGFLKACSPDVEIVTLDEDSRRTVTLARALKEKEETSP